MVTTAPRRRFRLQFSLRTLLVMVTIASLACGWLTVKLRQAARQREAVAALRPNMDLLYVHQKEGQAALAPPPSPAWLRALLGDDLFQRVDTVSLKGESLSPSQWEHLAALDSIRTLRPCFVQVRDADLVHLTGLKNLEHLHFIHMPEVSDAGLVHLEKLTALRGLDLVYTRITAAGAKRLKARLPNCRIVYIDRSKIDARTR